MSKDERVKEAPGGMAIKEKSLRVSLKMTEAPKGDACGAIYSRSECSLKNETGRPNAKRATGVANAEHF